ncbi:hypothetical protein, partial [Enterobacter hormaechei]
PPPPPRFFLLFRLQRIEKLVIFGGRVIFFKFKCSGVFEKKHIFSAAGVAKYRGGGLFVYTG